jgi:PAS domain S-box-containing protein
VSAFISKVIGHSAQHAIDQGLGHDCVTLFQPSRAFIDQLRLSAPLLLGFAGAAVTLLALMLFGMLYVQRARQRRLYATLLEAKLAVQSLNASLEFQVAKRTVELEEARSDLRTILDAVPPMIGYWDHKRLNRFANLAYGEFFGRSPEAMVGQPMREVLGEQLYSFSLPYVDAVLEGKLQVFERVIPQPDGSARYNLGKFLPDVGLDGTVIGFYALIVAARV